MLRGRIEQFLQPHLLHEEFEPRLGNARQHLRIQSPGVDPRGALLLQSLLARPEFAAATIPWLLQMSTLDPQKRGALQQGDLF